ncbi:MAG: fused MFS/spermidine synthase [Planctomycetota bacterium]
MTDAPLEASPESGPPESGPPEAAPLKAGSPRTGSSPGGVPLLTRLRLFVLLGALLLFGMEPLVGRLLLPACGGGFHVWAACLMFFQGALFLGYLYCHLLAGRLGRGHLLLVLLPLLFLPIGARLSGIDPDPGAPTASILGALCRWVAAPFVLLSTTGVIAQRWLAESDLPERENPYPLYAASNAGSFLSLLAYPLLIEPVLGLAAQRWLWSAGFLLYVGLALWTGLGAARRAPWVSGASAPDDAAGAKDGPSEGAGADRPDRIRPAAVLTWLLLSAAPSACLMAVTNVIAMDLGSLPLVWVVPLALYLLSFVLTFSGQERYPLLLRRTWPLALAFGLAVWVLGEALTWKAGLVHLAVLSAVCWVGHAELYRARPAPRALTAFYLCVSLGGWLGGVFVALLAPRLFSGLTEYPVALGALALTLAAVKRRDLRDYLRTGNPLWIGTSAVVVTLCLGAAAWPLVLPPAGRRPLVFRDEYGIYRIGEGPARDPLEPDKLVLGEDGLPARVRAITHGTILHGKERLDPAWQGRPIGYFHANSPLGEALRVRRRPLRAAIVGLGAGALVGNLRAGDEVTYYELDPLVERLARDHFHYLERTPARVLPVVLGDARLELQRAPAAAYDLILVDAFSSDAIPVHLLTREAFALYLEKLAPGGWLVLHISSRYYDLRPVVRATAGSLDPPLAGCLADKTRGGALAPFEDPSTAYVLARDPQDLAPLRALGWQDAASAQLAELRPWSDDYANVLGALWARLRE